MRVLLVDSGRHRTAAAVAGWREQLGLEREDEVAVISWSAPDEPLPVVDQMVFGPYLDWERREPEHPEVGLPRRGPRPTRPGVAHLHPMHPRRLARSAAAVRHGVRMRAASLLGFDPLDQLRSASRVGRAVRRRLRIRTDGVATDFGICVARSREVLPLARWAEVIAPVDTRSRKAAWVLARRVSAPEVRSDLTSAARVIARRRA